MSTAEQPDGLETQETRKEAFARSFAGFADDCVSTITGILSQIQDYERGGRKPNLELMTALVCGKKLSEDHNMEGLSDKLAKLNREFGYMDQLSSEFVPLIGFLSSKPSIKDLADIKSAANSVMSVVKSVQQVLQLLGTL